MRGSPNLLGHNRRVASPGAGVYPREQACVPGEAASGHNDRGRSLGRPRPHALQCAVFGYFITTERLTVNVNSVSGLSTTW
jgi:hypothetical protein